MEQPDYCTDEHLKYLDDLRDSGVTDMCAGARYLRQAFILSPDQASGVLIHWMRSFSERHPKKGPPHTSTGVAA